MRYKSIFYCANDPVKNIGSIRDYFIENTENLVTFHYQLGYSRKKSYMETYKKGKILFKKEFGFYNGKNVVIRNLIYYIIFMYVVIFHVRRKSFVIVISPLFCVFSSLFKLFKNIEFIFWIEDYFPDPKSLFMKIYNFLANYYSKRLKYVIYISPPISKVYKLKNNSKNKYRAIVNLGIKTTKIKSPSFSKTPKIGFIGIIRKEQGLDLVFEYLKRAKNSLLEVVGEGYDLEYYKEKANKLGISKKIIFHGSNYNPRDIVKNWDLAIALYHKSKNNFSIYSEPSKIKTYFSYGLPVITTNVTYIYSEIEKLGCGIVIPETTDDLGRAIMRIKNNYVKYLNGVKLINYKYEYRRWYDKKFNFLKN